MPRESIVVPKMGEGVQDLSLTAVTLGEVAMLQHAKNVLHSWQSRPPSRSLATLDSLTHGCQTREQISQANWPQQ
ncbi:MAG TPA: hypothetical protein VLE73_03590 [Candidatus Saccharimonadales bacterium]|nr:hypothetical protein [Candidatus Saccharimonadales bacterium]